jgi:hypothetical protein
MLMRVGFVRKIVMLSFITFFLICTAEFSFSATPTGTQCTCSGSKYIILDTNNNGVPDPPPEDPSEWPPGYDQGDPQASGYDAYWTMEQNGTEVYVKGHGIFPNPYLWENDYFSYVKSTGTETITLTEKDISNPPNNLVMTTSKSGGAEAFNKVDFFWKTGLQQYATATMVDSTGDGNYDSVVGQSNMNLTPVLFDNPIQFYTHPTTGKHYWHIPSVKVRLSRTGGDPYYGDRTSFQAFVPVGSNSLQIVCGSDTWGEVTLNAGGGPPIPTLNEWGAILITLLLLISGIWVMRKRGFGGNLPLA